jgi:hypothetical protein
MGVMTRRKAPASEGGRYKNETQNEKQKRQ